MKKIYAEPMTKVMKLNVASIMTETFNVSEGGNDPGEKAEPKPLF